MNDTHLHNFQDPTMRRLPKAHRQPPERQLSTHHTQVTISNSKHRESLNRYEQIQTPYCSPNIQTSTTLTPNPKNTHPPTSPRHYSSLLLLLASLLAKYASWSGCSGLASAATYSVSLARLALEPSRRGGVAGEASVEGLVA